MGLMVTTRGLEGCYLVRGAINPPRSNLPRSRNGRRDRDHSICEKAPGSPYSAPAGQATRHPSSSLETAPAGFSESARGVEGKGKRRTVGAMRRFRGRTGLGGIRASGSRPIHQRRCGVLVPWRCPVLTQACPLARFAGRRLSRQPRQQRPMGGLQNGMISSQDWRSPDILSS